MMNEFNFNQPQRQSVTGILVMFADTLQKLVRALWVPLAVFLFKAREPKHLWIFGAVMLTLLVIGVIIAYLRFRNFTFYLDEERQEFVVKKGVFSKSRISIQLGKIQQVNINQSLIQKISGVFSLEIDTAGSSGKEVKISAVREEMAQALKQKLLSFEDDFAQETAENQSFEKSEAKSGNIPTKFIKLSNLTLFKVGITSNYGRSIAILIGFFVTLYQSIKDFVTTFELDESEVDSVLERGLGLFSVAFLLIAAFFVIIIINVIRVVIKHFNFQMDRQNRSLAISSGLLARKNTLLNPSKVQVTSVSRNFFQKKFGIFDMSTKQASVQEVEEKNKTNNVIEIPGSNSFEKDEVLRIIFGKIPEKGQKLQPNFRYLIAKIIKAIIIPVGIYLTVAFQVEPAFREYFPLVFVYLLFVGILFYFGFKNNALFVNNEFVIKSSGAWDFEDEIIEPYKIQAITTKQYFWNKKADVGHVFIHTAAGDLQFKFGNFTEIKKLTNIWLYQVETSHKKWM